LLIDLFVDVSDVRLYSDQSKSSCSSFKKRL